MMSLSIFLDTCSITFSFSTSSYSLNSYNSFKLLYYSLSFSISSSAASSASYAAAYASALSSSGADPVGCAAW